MSAISLATAQEMLNLWIEADKAVSKNQEYKICDRTYTRADADVITSKITYYSNIVERLADTGTRRCRQVIY